MKSLSNSVTVDRIDENEDLKIITHVQPPKRRDSGKSFIPFRPYVKYLTGVRQKFSSTNGFDSWKVSGDDQIFFEQSNARCIGTLIEDCQTSDIIRWDIQAESTRLPMMCKLWIISDGAIIERGKPHLVQDFAVQVSFTGHNLRSILSSEHQINLIDNEQRFNRQRRRRRRRQSWHEINEYQSIAYYQYSRPVRSGGSERAIQCDFDRICSQVYQNKLSTMKEDEEQSKETCHRTESIEQHSIITQTESKGSHRSTTTDSQLVQIFNLNLETNEILLSPIVNPYRSIQRSTIASDLFSYIFNEKQYQDRSISTGEDYPHWWNRFSTSSLLSDRIIDPNEEKKVQENKFSSSPRREQTNLSPRTRQRSSSSNSHHYEILDENDQSLHENSERNNSFDRFDERKSTFLSTPRTTKTEFSSKHSDTGYNTFSSSPLTYDFHRSSSNSTSDQQIKFTQRNDRNISDYSTKNLLSNLVQRYETTVRERQRAFAIVNDQLLNVEDLLQRYKEKLSRFSSKVSQTTSIQTKNQSNQISTEDIQIGTNNSMDNSQSKEELIRANALLSKHLIDKYRSMPGITSEEMIQGYIPSSRFSSLLNSHYQATELGMIDPLLISPRPKYCDLCVTDRSRTSSAWIRYNERRIEELQKRIDLMLKIDDQEEAKFLLEPVNSLSIEKNKPVQQRIDDFIMGTNQIDFHSKTFQTNQNSTTKTINRKSIGTIHQSLPTTPRASRANIRSTTPSHKSVRIMTPTRTSTYPQRRISPSTNSQPMNSILRHTTLSQTTLPLRPTTTTTKPAKPSTTHVWQSRVDGQVYVLEQFSIPRYYRLYNDASFREIYNLSRTLDSCLPTKSNNIHDYSSMVKHFALEQPFKSPLTGKI